MEQRQCRNVTVTVPESVEIVVLWNGTEQGDAIHPHSHGTARRRLHLARRRTRRTPDKKPVKHTTIDLYIKAGRKASRAQETIPIENLKYSNYGITS